jgi:hypothetical protein
MYSWHLLCLAISVAVRAPALDVAQQALFARQVFGIVEIPPDTEREVLKGNAARGPAYVDSAYFIIFNRTLQGILEGAGDINVASASHGNREDGAAVKLALAAQSPIEVLMAPLYNPTGGYASYSSPRCLCADHSANSADGAATLAGFGFAPRTSARGCSDGHSPTSRSTFRRWRFFLSCCRESTASPLSSGLPTWPCSQYLSSSQPALWVWLLAAFSGIARRLSLFSSRRHCHSFFSSGFPGRGR